AGKCGIRKTDKKLPAVQALSPEEAFAHAEFIALEHTTHAKLFENQRFIWGALKQIASYLQFRLKPAVLGQLMGKSVISNTVFMGSGTIFEQGAVIKGPAWIGEKCHVRSG